MSALTTADIPRILAAIRSKSAADLAQFTSGPDPVLSKRPDGSFYLSRELFSIAIKAAKSNEPHAKDAQALLNQAGKGKTSEGRGATTRPAYPAPPVDSNSQWIADALAVAFAARSYGYGAAMTMVGPLAHALEKAGRMRIVPVAGGTDRLEFTDAARDELTALSATNPTALLLSGILRAQEVQSGKSVAASKSTDRPYTVRRVERASASNADPGPEEMAAGGQEQSSVPPADVGSNGSSEPGEEPSSQAATERLTVADVTNALHDLVREYQKGDLKAFGSYQAALKARDAELYEYMLGAQPLLKLQDGTVTWTTEGTSLLRARRAEAPNDANLNALAALTAKQAKAPASGKAEPQLTPEQRQALLRAVRTLYMASLQVSADQAIAQLKKTEPNTHAALFETTAINAPLLRLAGSRVEMTAAGIAELKKESASAPRSQLVVELATYFNVPAVLPQAAQPRPAASTPPAPANGTANVATAQAKKDAPAGGPGVTPVSGLDRTMILKDLSELALAGATGRLGEALNNLAQSDAKSHAIIFTYASVVDGKIHLTPAGDRALRDEIAANPNTVVSRELPSLLAKNGYTSLLESLKPPLPSVRIAGADRTMLMKDICELAIASGAGRAKEAAEHLARTDPKIHAVIFATGPSGGPFAQLVDGRLHLTPAGESALRDEIAANPNTVVSRELPALLRGNADAPHASSSVQTPVQVLRALRTTLLESVQLTPAGAVDRLRESDSAAHQAIFGADSNREPLARVVGDQIQLTASGKAFLADGTKSETTKALATELVQLTEPRQENAGAAKTQPPVPSSRREVQLDKAPVQSTGRDPREDETPTIG